MKRILKGKVVSDKMDKTVVVKVEALRTHPLYHKKYKVSKKFVAHDEGNTVKVDDIVVIEETKPQSLRKKWQVVKEPDSKKAKDSKISKKDENDSTAN